MNDEGNIINFTIARFNAMKALCVISPQKVGRFSGLITFQVKFIYNTCMIRKLYDYLK